MEKLSYRFLLATLSLLGVGGLSPSADSQTVYNGYAYFNLQNVSVVNRSPVNELANGMAYLTTQLNSGGKVYNIRQNRSFSLSFAEADVARKLSDLRYNAQYNISLVCELDGYAKATDGSYQLNGTRGVYAPINGKIGFCGFQSTPQLVCQSAGPGTTTGSFCNGNGRLVEWQCYVKPCGTGWVKQDPYACWQRLTPYNCQ